MVEPRQCAADFLQGIWVFVPVLGAVLAHAPVLVFDLFPALARPIDGGVTIRGKRLFGDNKTWRGALAMATGIVVLTLVLSYWPAWWSRLPAEIRSAGPLLYGALVALGTVFGELPNSFLKRQLGIGPGEQRRSLAGISISIFDQGDFVLGIWLFLLPIWVMTPIQALVTFMVVTVVHVVVNLVGYAIGARKSLL